MQAILARLSSNNIKKIHFSFLFQSVSVNHHALEINPKKAALAQTKDAAAALL